MTTTTDEVALVPKGIAQQYSRTPADEIDSSSRMPHSIWLFGGAILIGHLVVDLLAAVVPSILGVIEVHCHLQPSETAWLLGIGALCSGLTQPVCAWIVDRYHWYQCCGLGVMLAAIFLCLIGLATSFGMLLPIYIVGMVGVGMFHPVAASSMGGLSELRRSPNMSLFFVAGMFGGVCGATFTPRLITGSGGFSVLYWGIFPGLVAACLIHRVIKHLPHHRTSHQADTIRVDDIRLRWFAVAVLYVASVLRFSVNLSLTYLYVRWVQAATATAHRDWAPTEIASYSVPMVGNLNACMLSGMALGGLAAGVIVRHGNERWPLVLCPIAFCSSDRSFPPSRFAVGLCAERTCRNRFCRNDSHFDCTGTASAASPHEFGIELNDGRSLGRCHVESSLGRVWRAARRYPIDLLYYGCSPLPGRIDHVTFAHVFT